MATYSTIGETPAEVEIAATVTGALLPQLREALLALQALKMAWYANGIPEMIESATADSEALIAGFPAATWAAWGTVFTSLEEWLNTPLPDTKLTPLAVLSRRYTRRGEK